MMLREKIIDILDGGFLRHDFGNPYCVDVVPVPRDELGEYADEIIEALTQTAPDEDSPQPYLIVPLTDAQVSLWENGQAIKLNSAMQNGAIFHA